MAKALIGHLQRDQRIPARLGLENQRLRGRVVELEALVLRLQAENDRLRADNERVVPKQTTVSHEPQMLPA